jgi:HAD superfamily hydrolase (TIGR01490 family)
VSLWAPYKLRLMSAATVYRAWTEHMAWLVRGVPVDEASAIWDAIADEVMDDLRPAVLTRLRDHQAQGHRVVLVTGSFRPIAEAVAARLNIHDVLAAPLEARDGRYTGRIIPPLCQGPGKRAHVEAFLAGTGIDMAASYAYADSFVDEDLLSLVGHPTAVAPDRKLAAIAAERGWPVIV